MRVSLHPRQPCYCLFFDDSHPRRCELGGRDHSTSDFWGHLPLDPFMLLFTDVKMEAQTNSLLKVLYYPVMELVSDL